MEPQIRTHTEDGSEKDRTGSSVAGVWIKRTRILSDLSSLAEYALIKRSETEADYPGQLGLLTETMETDDEDLSKTALRGVSSEFKNSLQVLSHNILSPILQDKSGASFQLFCVTVENINGSIAYSEEIDSVEWLTAGEIKRRYEENPEMFLPRMDGPISLLE